MQRFIRKWVSASALMIVFSSWTGIFSSLAQADSAIERGLFQVSISLAGSAGAASGLTAADDIWSYQIGGVSVADARPNSLQLPDSVHFSGLAGTLNLVIDKSNGTPLIEGIELAPREILRFVANDSENIRGFHGQVSIRLDF